MDLTALRYFKAVADAGSIRRAADRLHITPSAVSRQIVGLEHRLGAELLERTALGIRLTPAGELVASHADSSLRQIERIQSAVDELKGLRRGKVGIYAIEGVVSRLLPQAIAEFCGQHPEITFEVTVASTDRTIEALIRDQCDIGITMNAEERSEIGVLCDHSDECNIIAARSHPIAGIAEPGLAEALQYPLALLNAAYGIRQLVDQALRAARLEPQIRLVTNSVELVRATVRTGVAISFMTRWGAMADAARHELVAIPMRPGTISPSHVQVCVHQDRQLSPASKRFAEHLKAFLETRLRGAATP